MSPGAERICLSSCWAARTVFVAPERCAALEGVRGRTALSLAACKPTFRKEYQKCKCCFWRCQPSRNSQSSISSHCSFPGKTLSHMILPKGNKYVTTYLPYHTRSSEALLVLAYASHLSLCSSRALPSNRKCLCGDTEHHLWPLPLEPPPPPPPKFGIVLCAAEKTNLLALGCFSTFRLQQKVFCLGIVFLHHDSTVMLFFCC